MIVPAVPACCTLKEEDEDGEEGGGGGRGRQEAVLWNNPDAEGGWTMLIESSVT